jgi:steroid 5-alpha reductase family enzyme
LSGLGIVIFFGGLILETIADIQKYQFKNQHSKTWIDTGVWRISRHPNYLGEIILWIGVSMFVLPSLPSNLQMVSLVGPVYIAVLLIFVSGIPLVEKSSDKKWGGNEKSYLKYKSKVPVLIPSVSSLCRIFDSNYQQFLLKNIHLFYISLVL